MIDWVDCLGKTWGTYMRHDPDATSTSLWTRHVDLIRTGITTDGTFWNGRPYKYPRHQIPIRSMSRDQFVFHRAWKSLTGNLQELTWTHYVPHAKPCRKLQALNLTAEVYRNSLHEAHESIESFIVGRE